MATETGEITGSSLQSDCTITTDSNSNIIWIDWMKITIADIWTSWTGDITGSEISSSMDRVSEYPSIIQPKRTAEEIRRQRLNAARSRGIQNREENQKIKAKNRAKKLLMDLIGKVDYKKFLQLGYLDVEGNSGRTYRIRARHRIEVREGDIKIESLCITTPDHYLPEHDEVVWKKLLVEGNEELLLKVANH